jgi:hypothetical protein
MSYDTPAPTVSRCTSSPNARSQRNLCHNTGSLQCTTREIITVNATIYSEFILNLKFLAPGFARRKALPESVYLGSRSSLAVQHTKPTCSAQCRKHQVVPEPVSRFCLTALHTCGESAVDATREMVIGWVLSGRVMKLGKERNVVLGAQANFSHSQENTERRRPSLGPSTTFI